MAKVEKDYEEFLGLLNKHKVKYCIVGAYALAFHAVPRYTKDMDVFLEQSLENASKVISVLEQFGFKSLKIKAEDLLESGTTLQLGFEPIRIDLLTSIDGCSFRQVWKNRKKGRYGGERVSYIGLRDLMQNKAATGRKQDQVDLDVLKNSI